VRSGEVEKWRSKERNGGVEELTGDLRPKT